MRQKKLLIPVVLSLLSALMIIGGGIWLRQMAASRINDERKQQLEELTTQISGTFENALDSSRACVGTAANLFSDGTYRNKADIIESASKIRETVLTGDDSSEENDIILFLDSSGVCYDKDGAKGVWGDFDQVVNMDDYYTFIADSVNYDGVHWAFVRKLDTPVTTSDEKITISYVVLLKTMESMSKYYASEAYDDVCETYILRENGTRMYDSVTEEDTISAYNIYKYLKETESKYEGSFDDVMKNLEENNVACGNYEQDGTEYCYSLAWQSDYQFVLLFLIPTDAVAVNTVTMVSSMMGVFFATAVIILVLILASVSAFVMLANNRRISNLKEKNVQEMKEKNEQLATLNNTLKKSNRAARSALDIARSANRAKSSFLSNMSHDIRTPLNAIIGFLTFLERDADKPDQVRLYTEKIRVSSQHLLNLINDILDMSRIESGKTTLNSQEFSVGELIEETRTVIAPQAREKNLSFTIDTADTAELIVSGDKLRLNQILLNLLSNAVKYTPEGGDISLDVEKTGKSSPQMVTLKFSVKDNGIGMSPEFQKRVFEPFEREQTSTSSGIQGTGLGMAITKNLVDLMGGIIFVDSIPGEGSTFTMELSFPLAGEKRQNASEEPTTQTEKKTEEENVLEGLHFLVAEDNEINAEIIKELLAMEDATCEIAVNGKEALEFFEKSEPGTYDAIFMDIQMPVMGGYESTRKIRSCGHPDAARIPIAAMTANAFAEDVQKALQSGMNTHIPKPVDMKKIKEFIAGEKRRNTLG